MADQGEEMERILERLQSLELRLSKLENSLNIIENAAVPESGEPLQPIYQPLSGEILNEEEKGIEEKIGRFGLAWLGNIVLFFGIRQC